jgi:hypothetical protein
MTPGQIITAGEIAAGLLIGAVAVYRGRGGVASACIALIWAVALTRAFKYGLPPDLHFAAWTALWVAVGGWVMRGGMRDESRPVAVSGGLCVASGLAYALAWLAASPTVIWAPPMVLADLSVIAALGALLWGAAGGSRDRISEAKRSGSALPGVVCLRGRSVADGIAGMDQEKTRERRSR